MTAVFISLLLQVEWQKSYEDGLRKAKEKGAYAVVHFSGEA
jgi:hypothetical protein